MNKFTQPFKRSRSFDQSSYALGPCWIHEKKATTGTPELDGHVYQSGESRTMANAVIGLLNLAKESAIVCTFLLSDDEVVEAIEKAAKRGIRIYLLLSTEARLAKEPGEGEFEKHVLEEHKRMLRRLANGLVLIRSASHYHAKFVIIDPNTAYPAGVLLTANLTREALVRNEELAVRLSPDEAKAVLPFVKWAMWEEAEHEMTDANDRLKAVKPLKLIEPPPMHDRVLVTTSFGRSIQDTILKLIDEASQRIIMSSFGWEAGHPVVEALCDKARNGVKVVVLARTRPAAMPALQALTEAGVLVYGFKWLHAKAIWTDRKTAMIMSANIQHDGLDRGFELGLLLSGSRSDSLRSLLEAWQEKAPWRLSTTSRAGEVLGHVKIWDGRQLKDEQIRTYIEHDLGNVQASCLTSMDKVEPRFPNREKVPPVAHEIRYTWSVVPPVLSKGSKEQFQPSSNKASKSNGSPERISYSPPLFKEPNNRLVVAIRSPDELNAAKTLASKVGAESVVLFKGQ